MSEIAYLEIAELGALIKRRKLSPVEATEAMLGRIALQDGALHSYVSVNADAALIAARQFEAEIAAERYRGTLHGVPIAIKDLFWTEGCPTAGGMAIHRNFRPQRDATTVARLRAAGAVILGKLATTEGAYSDYHPSIVPR